jgi:methanogenic corrinoid protein MtbC1
MLGIGALSRLSDVPVNTLRTWERRYGWPSPSRTAGGQRLYSPADAERLRLVARAMERGHRPAQVMVASVEVLRAWAGDASAPPVPPPVAARATDPTLEAWMDAVRRLDGEALVRGFRSECSRVGLLPFLEDRVQPLLERIGTAWVDGELAVYQEHEVSERLRDFLVAQWRPMVSPEAPPVVCATLPGERHLLGIHMAAAVLATQGLRPVFLGADTPAAEIAACAASTGARAVAVSVGPTAESDSVRAALAVLSDGLRPGVALLVGGAGVPTDGVPGIRLTGWSDLARWARAASG